MSLAHSIDVIFFEIMPFFFVCTIFGMALAWSLKKARKEQAAGNKQFV
jgi:hypothetical protein